GGQDWDPSQVSLPAHVVDALEILLITKDNLDGATVRDLFERAQQLGLTLGRLPKLTDFKSGAADKVEVRPIAVEDLLGRPQTVLDRAGMSRLIEGRPVLVTGAGGSIGAELVRQVAALKPSRLVLLDSSEFALYRIDLELSEQEGSPDHPALLADVRDGTRLEQIFSRYRPEVVFHAAALKHVPLVEANPFEGLRTNCLGTLELARAARRHGARAMVMISTDKAVNPTNIMGASKRIAEMITQANDLDSESPTRFVTVRFGNVLGSTGSVVPLFQRQLARGGPLTVTHPDMKRYFMTIREAVELVLQASVHALLVHDGKVEPTGCIHVLDMGEPVRILDLAEQMVRLAGREPGRDIEIKFTGLRPGEKLFEEIFHGSEELKESGVDGVFVAHPRALQRDALYAALEQLAQACQSEDHDRLIDLVQGLVPEYQPSQT
ncbi:MAG: UDP-N-acetylglucosamine 4,6-dehydratase family protein, partial [Rhodospirillales bacterium]